ncbi:MAG: peptide-methionine (R)-S-oxide reductase MsrB [Candidatus Woesearchaeota archaeon]|nr:MAG: peptide-methionine (R)-S-oxide reductase MsrB [Candidatus Woesearchaeota archaeon]
MNKEIYKNNWEKGVYKCSKCKHPLFKSDDKFDSGTRWPSFRKSVKEGVATKQDTSFFMVRTELLCKKCKQHLGHVFDDGKIVGDKHPEAGKRFCILSSALKFESKGGKSGKK